jgi:outer membrane protein
VNTARAEGPGEREKSMMKTSKITWSLLLIAIAFSFAAQARADEIKIAFVDVRRALNETVEGKKAMQKLQAEKDKMQKQIDVKEKALLSMKETLEKQQNILSKEALQKKAEEYYTALQELQKMYYELQQDLGQKEAKATQGILVKMQDILKEMGQAGGYTMIYDSSGGAVVWAPSYLDLTDKLITEYNKKNK